MIYQQASDLLALTALAAFVAALLSLSQALGG